MVSVAGAMTVVMVMAMVGSMIVRVPFVGMFMGGRFLVFLFLILRMSHWGISLVKRRPNPWPKINLSVVSFTLAALKSLSLHNL